MGIRAERDSVVTVGDSLVINPQIVVRDSLVADLVQTETDTVKPPGLLTDIVEYQAADYMRLSPKDNRMYLYDQAQISYEDMVITAGLIIVDNAKMRCMLLEFLTLPVHIHKHQFSPRVKIQLNQIP